MIGATSDYWTPPFYLLEARGFEVWLFKLAEWQMIRPSFVPSAEIRGLRDLTRHRASLVAERTSEKQPVEKLLEESAAVKESAEKKGKASTGSGSPYLARVLGEAAIAAGRSSTFLGQRYRRRARRRGQKRPPSRLAGQS